MTPAFYKTCDGAEPDLILKVCPDCAPFVDFEHEGRLYRHLAGGLNPDDAWIPLREVSFLDVHRILNT